VHRLLQTLPDLPVDEQPHACKRFLGSPVHGLTNAEQEKLAAATLGVLRHQQFSDLFGANSQAEVPVVGLVGSRAISAQVDRLAVTDREVLIVDYKTGGYVPTTADAVAPLYLQQMAAYRATLSLIYPGRRIVCLLLYTTGPTLIPLPDALLDRYLSTGMPNAKLHRAGVMKN
jgi:ATP-dependent helicase/nuclease subunit A